MKKIKFYDIYWDIDYVDIGQEEAATNLPIECELEVDDNFNVEFQGEQVLYDQFGFYVLSFKSVESAPLTAEMLLNTRIHPQVKDIKN
jgi:hypothetical protein